MKEDVVADQMRPLGATVQTNYSSEKERERKKREKCCLRVQKRTSSSGYLYKTADCF